MLDGKRIVYRVAESEQGLRILNLEDRKTVTLTTEYDNFPAWSPKGDLIEFTSFRDGDFEIYTVRPDGSGVRRLTHTGGNDAHGIWSPDGGREINVLSTREYDSDSVLFRDQKSGNVALVFCVGVPSLAQRPQPKPRPTGPWMNSSLSPDERADLVVKEMTVDEKIALLHGVGMPTDDASDSGERAFESRRGLRGRCSAPGHSRHRHERCGLWRAIERRERTLSTALPANVAAAASWDTDAAYEYGALIGRELRAQGFNMSLGGGVNLTRDPRNGRTFEYLGEDQSWPARWWRDSSRERSRAM